MADYFRFRVELSGIQPAVYRTFLLTSKATFHALHMAIQDACEWDNCHLFAFRDKKGKSIAGLPEDFGLDDPDPDARKVKLADWFSLTKNKKCVYEYDFGDSWLHDVTLETIEQHDGTWKRRLLAGARAFPPEDCGGIPGYLRCVELATQGMVAQEDAEDEEMETEFVEWLGDWSPEHFNLASAKLGFDK